MDMSVNMDNRVMYFNLSGELDSHSYEGIKSTIDTCISRYLYDKVVFDFTRLTFMDSTGIGMLIGRYKILKRLKKPCYILGANSNIAKVLKMSGIFTIIKQIERKEDVV